MENLKQRILNDIEATRGLTAEMARLAGYATGAKLKGILSKENGNIEKFGGFVKIVHHMYPYEKFAYMEEFAININPNQMMARFMLEYVTLYRMSYAKEVLLKKMLNCTNSESREWAFVYDIDEKLIKNKIAADEAIEILMNRTYSTVEMKIFSRIVQTYADFDMNNLHVLRTMHKEISESLKKVKNDFARDSLRARFYVIDSRVNLLNDNKDKVLESVFLVKNALDPIKSSNFLQYANSYLLTDYEKAKKFLNEAMEYSEGNVKVKKDIIMSSNFAAILHKRFEDYKEDGELSNLLYYYCRKGDVVNAEKLLKDIEFDSLTDYRKAFNCYYRGILYNDESLLSQSIVYFNNSGDKYWKKIAVDELAAHGVEKHLLKALIS